MTEPERRYATVTVTFHPDLDVLRRQLAALEGDVTVVVDNASGADAAREIARARDAVVLLEQPRNIGLAAALNIGAQEALRREPGLQYLVFLDQDTEPGAGGVAALVEAAAALRRADPKTGLVGPLMVDAATGLAHGIHVIRGWRWTRVYPGRDAVSAVACASVNGSGMLVPADVFRALGGFEEALFIDHVDSEYSFRAAAAGYRLYTVPGAAFAHRMGERSLRFWLGGWRVWPHRSPARHAFLFRNAVLLMRRPYVPAVWKAWAVAKLALTALVHLVADAQRFPQLAAMLRGVREGLRAPGAPAA